MTIYSPGTYLMVLSSIKDPVEKDGNPSRILLPLIFKFYEGTDQSQYLSWLYFSNRFTYQAFRLAANSLLDKVFQVDIQIKDVKNSKWPASYNVLVPNWEFGFIEPALRAKEISHG